jgi:soluble lytic murein transglycosylase
LRKFWLSILPIITVINIFCLCGFFVLRARYPVDYRDTVEKYYDDWRFALSVMKAESNFNVRAKSSAGACGLMQLLPETAAFIAEREGVAAYDLFVAEDNIRLGCAYLSYLQGKFSPSAAIAAYNAGEGTVREWLQNKAYSADGVTLQTVPYAETKGYMKKIKKYYAIYRKIYLTNSLK